MDKLTLQQEDHVIEEQMQIYRRSKFWNDYIKLDTPEQKINFLYHLAEEVRAEIIRKPRTRDIAIGLSKYFDDLIEAVIEGKDGKD